MTCLKCTEESILYIHSFETWPNGVRGHLRLSETSKISGREVNMINFLDPFILLALFYLVEILISVIIFFEL